MNKKIIEEYSFKTFLRYCNINGMPDIIHSHSVFWGAIAANSISKKAGIPFIHTEHLSAIIHSDEYDHHPFCGFIIECLNGSKKNIFVSEKFKEAVEKKYSVKDAITIPNIVNPIFFNKKRSGLPLSTFNIINIGAHIDTKNQTTLLRSLEILRKSIDKDIKLVIVGHGPLYGQLSQQAKSLMSGITVEFLHSANKEVIAELMSRSHLLISTSLFETFGLTVAEANAVGLPVVSYRTMGAEDIVTPQNGLLVSDNSPEMFAAAMIEIYKNYWEYDPEIISADCLCKFSEKVIAPQIIGIYEKILEGKNNSGYE